ncbi:uncharacterized protein LOC132639536 [Lycium barbarum]|uniref:uncharacterized protein LOC132639536 n=1 Tax=Lycium barbarum TaxID=112863 RepID=UPI00293E12F8|nr:uncharacterized protein LOC132639536 [Lycium barbarum]
MPTLEEVKKAVFELSSNSAGGPDGMIGTFYQTLPKSITHTNLVLLPKKNNIETFADMRAISLSKFINKVISRVVQDKLEGLLPSLISPNQSGFVKGRCIIENVLTQEVVTGIRLTGKLANVVLKLDMAKAYDRVSWSYLIRVLKKMGFAEVSIDMVWRALNSLFENNDFRSYGMPKWSASLNHLAYADDTIIFTSADPRFLELIMEILHDYEQAQSSECAVEGRFASTRDNIEQEIWWKPMSGTANVWFDNLTKLGALYHIVPDDFVMDDGVQDVKELMLQDGWNILRLQQLFPMDIVDHILEELHFHEPTKEWDRPRWMITALGKFTVGTAWELLRRKASKSDDFKNM